MKANAPERIYVKITHPISDEYTEIVAFEDGDGIEYAHTDAFIKKACEFLDGCIPDYIDLKHANVDINVDNKRFIEDFKNYMEGE